MSDSETCYCRLCAEPTDKNSLISPDEEVAVTSKINMKMLWINVDVSTQNTLPKSICFSCFDLLERTFLFLHSVRTAQSKLNTIFSEQCDDVQITDNIGKPVDKDWETFQERKPEVKVEVEVGFPNEEGSGSRETSGEMLAEALTCLPSEIKDERSSTEYISQALDVFDTSDEDDVPLVSVVKKKKKKKEFQTGSSLLAADLNPVIPYPVLTWEDYTWRCGHCDALLEDIQSLRLHSLQIHESCCVFKCNDCSKNMANFSMFVKHVREHKKLLRYCCEICNKSCRKISLLKKHYLTHQTDLSFVCENCGTSFETPKLLSDHVTMYSKYLKKDRKRHDANLKCDVCDRQFKTRSNLVQHSLLHTERSRNFSCHKCGKMFYMKGTLTAHMMVHDEVKRYKCEHCSLSFRARGNLQSHMSLHSDIKPFICEQCGKSFRVKRLLKSHYIVHTDLMPFRCEYCSKTFRFKTRLNLHMRQHTGVKPYNCIYCQRDFTNGSNYKKHMKRRHNIDTSKKKYVDLVQNEEGILDNN